MSMWWLKNHDLFLFPLWYVIHYHVVYLGFVWAAYNSKPASNNDLCPSHVSYMLNAITTIIFPIIFTWFINIFIINGQTIQTIDVEKFALFRHDIRHPLLFVSDQGCNCKPMYLNNGRFLTCWWLVGTITLS